jgi:hypothetical protein
MHVGEIFCPFAKAFDCMNHEIWLAKLIKNEPHQQVTALYVPSVTFNANLLMRRRHLGTHSEVYPILCGLTYTTDDNLPAKPLVQLQAALKWRVMRLVEMDM